MGAYVSDRAAHGGDVAVAGLGGGWGSLQLGTHHPPEASAFPSATFSQKYRECRQPQLLLTPSSSQGYPGPAGDRGRLGRRGDKVEMGRPLQHWKHFWDEFWMGLEVSTVSISHGGRRTAGSVSQSR